METLLRPPNADFSYRPLPDKTAQRSFAAEARDERDELARRICKMGKATKAV